MKGVNQKHCSILLFLVIFLCTFTLFQSTNEQRGNATENKSGKDKDEETGVVSLPHVLRIDPWPGGLKFAQWNHPSELPKEFLQTWVDMLEQLLPAKCNIVDIGAHAGDTTLPLAKVARGGKVVAFEMGPPFEMLQINKRLNPQLDLDIYNLAISDRNTTVFYNGPCNGCNGGISEGGVPVKAVALVPFLLQKYSKEFVQNICMVKIDTEGHDPVILRSLPSWFRPKLIWTEWFVGFESGKRDSKSSCSQKSSDFFTLCRSLGYQIFRNELPIRESQGCSVYQPDLLLMRL